jgi:anti-sigma B factor antagonist
MVAPGEPMTDCTVEVTPAIGGDSVTVALAGRFDAMAAASIQADLDRAMADAPRTALVDLARVTFLDSAALAVLVRLRREQLARGGRLVLRRPDSEDAMRIFRLTRFDHVFGLDDGLGVG